MKALMASGGEEGRVGGAGCFIAMKALLASSVSVLSYHALSHIL